MSTEPNGVVASIPVVRVLRCQKTHRYLASNGWSDDAESAKNFAHGIDAVRDCVSRNLVEIDLVLRVRGGSADLFCMRLR